MKHNDSNSDDDAGVDVATCAEIRQQYRLDAPLDKVWRAISVPALRAHWLPDLDLAAAAAVDTVPGQEVRYAMRERQPPFLESQVILRLMPAPDGGTILTIIHAVDIASVAANDSGSVFMLAA